MTTRTDSADSATAVLFDVDGTLMDSVYQHVMAWWEAFADAGHAVSAYDIHRTIGRAAEDLVEALLAHEDERVVEGHSQGWGAVRDRTTAFAKVPELLRHCATRDIRVVLCTSGAGEDLEHFVRAIGGDDPVHAIVSSEDVEESKPSPQIVHKALEAAGVPAARAVMVGDTTFDMQAAAGAGVRGIGVLCGGISEAELRAAGAEAVYPDPAALLAHLEDWLPARG
ncbi:MAG TPA: HAD family hydrolase [Mycobacteriales bacterium]|nr:HAD family hydrolase [Mycobacteriales bacterium]